MMYPLVRELAVAGIPVTVTGRVLKIARQPHYRWLARPVSDSERIEAQRANALFDAHRDDPEFGHRLLADEAREAGQPMADRTAWRVCSDNGWFSVFAKKQRGKKRAPGAPAHDDLVRRDFTASGANSLWLADITEHLTGEGKFYLCAIKDVYSNRIVGYSIGDRMKARLAVQALDNAAARRGAAGRAPLQGVSIQPAAGGPLSTGQDTPSVPTRKDGGLAHCPAPASGAQRLTYSSRKDRVVRSAYPNKRRSLWLGT